MSVANVNVPSFLDSNTGNWLLDAMPCVTLIMCLPTMRLFYSSRRYYDVCVATVGFTLAMLFHACHMHEDGLQAATFMGVGGATWRTLDILVCQYVLVRTVRDAVGSPNSKLVSALPNYVLPGLLCSYMLTFSSLPMKVVGKTTLVMMVSTLVAKLLVDGTQHFPAYTSDGVTRVFLSFLVAFGSFWMPHKMPEMYWFWHSMWHVFLGVGYYLLYSQLCRSGKAFECEGKGFEDVSVTPPLKKAN